MPLRNCWLAHFVIDISFTYLVCRRQCWGDWSGTPFHLCLYLLVCARIWKFPWIWRYFYAEKVLFHRELTQFWHDAILSCKFHVVWQWRGVAASRYVSWLPSFSVEVTHMLGYTTRQRQAPTSQFDNMVVYRLSPCILYFWPSVLWCCWLGGRKGIQPVKTWVVGCWRGYRSGARCRLAYGPADATATHCLLLQ